MTTEIIQAWHTHLSYSFGWEKAAHKVTDVLDAVLAPEIVQVAMYDTDNRRNAGDSYLTCQRSIQLYLHRSNTHTCKRVKQRINMDNGGKHLIIKYAKKDLSVYDK